MTALIVCAATAAMANTAHHESGGGGSAEAACIRWEPVPVDMAGADMASVDMSGVDMAGLDMGPRGDMATAVRCAERASLFNCAYVPGSTNDRENALGLALCAAIVVFEIVRARRRHRG